MAHASKTWWLMPRLHNISGGCPKKSFLGKSALFLEESNYFSHNFCSLPKKVHFFLENIFLGQPPDQLLCETWHLMIRPQNEHIPRQHRQTDCMIPILIRSGIKQSIYLGCLVSVFLGAILPYVMDTIGFILSQFIFLLFYNLCNLAIV